MAGRLKNIARWVDHYSLWALNPRGPLAYRESDRDR